MLVADNGVQIHGFLTFCDAGRVEAHPGESWKALAERGVLAVVLCLGLEVDDDVHAKHLGRRVPRRADELLLVRLRQEDPVRAHVRLRALVLVRLQHGRAGRQTISVISSSESSVAGRLDVTEVQRDGTPQRLMRTVVRSSAIEFRSGATLSDKSRRRRYGRGRRRARAPTSGHLVGSTSGMAPRVSAIRTASTQKKWVAGTRCETSGRVDRRARGGVVFRSSDIPFVPSEVRFGDY